MAYTTSMLLSLQEAIATGAMSVYYGDKRVEYRSLAEMRSIEAAMQLELGITKKGSGRKYAQFNKGLDCPLN